MRFVIYTFVVCAVFFLWGASQCNAATRCERDSSGGICCWDTNEDGPFKPISCE
jgi:hypothetical protein